MERALIGVDIVMLIKWIGTLAGIYLACRVAEAILTGWIEFRPEPPLCFRCGEPMKLGKDRIFRPVCDHKDFSAQSLPWPKTDLTLTGKIQLKEPLKCQRPQQ